MKRWARFLAVSLVAAAAVAGCSGDDRPVPLGEPHQPSSSAAPSPSFATDDPVQAYLGWFDAVYQAERSLDPNHPGLTTYGQGPALADVRRRIASFKAQGVRLDKPDIVVAPKVTATGRSRGSLVNEVTGCVIEPAENFVDVNTGRPRVPKGGHDRQVTAKWVGVMVQMPDGWHLDGSRIEDVASCSAIS